MMPGAESHTRVQHYDALTFSRRVFAPCGADCDSAADTKRMEMLFPRFLPVLFLDHALPKRGYVGHMRHKTHTNIDAAAPFVKRLIHRQIGSNDRPLVAGRRFAFVGIEPAFLLHRDAAMPVAVENLRQRFHEFRRGADAQFKPLQ